MSFFDETARRASIVQAELRDRRERAEEALRRRELTDHERDALGEALRAWAGGARDEESAEQRRRTADAIVRKVS